MTPVRLVHCRLVALTIALLGALSPAQAWPAFVVNKLDDSMSIVHGGQLSLRWDSDNPATRNSKLARVSSRVTLVLSTAAYAGMNVRIHQVMGPIPGSWQSSWRSSNGRFLDGKSRPGERVVIFEGQLPEGNKRLEGDMTYEFVVDGAYVNDYQNLSFSYEIEVVR